MEKNAWIDKAKKHLYKLCLDIPNRRVGSEGNRLATDYFADVLRSFNFQVRTPEFKCVDWEDKGASLRVGGEDYQVFSSPYSLGCQVKGPLVTASTVEELETVEADDKILLPAG